MAPNYNSAIGKPWLERGWLHTCAAGAFLPIMAQRQANPPILIVTSQRKDRAHPPNARKMAAQLQAIG